MKEAVSLESLPESFCNLSALEELDLSESAGIEFLPKSFGTNLASLRVLNLTNCASLMELPESVGQLTSLEDLVLRGAYGVSLPPTLGNLSDDLQNLYLTGIGLETLPEWVGELAGLRSLVLDDNALEEYVALCVVWRRSWFEMCASVCVRLVCVCVMHVRIRGVWVC